MTKKELIEILKEIPDDMEIKVPIYMGQGFRTIIKTEINRREFYGKEDEVTFRIW